MANPLTTFIQERFIQPRVDRALSVSKDTNAYAVGVSPFPLVDLKETYGQLPDYDYPLLYAVRRKHVDVSSCIRRWAGGVTSSGWRLGLMDATGEPTAAQQRRMDELTLWLKNPNPSKRFYRLLYELVEHLGVSGNAYLNRTHDTKGNVRELWNVHSSSMRVVADQHGAVLGYVQWFRGRVVAEFAPDEISHFSLPSTDSDLYGTPPLADVMEEVAGDLEALRSNRAITQNGFKPSAILNINKDLKSDQAEKLVRQLNEKHVGAGKAHQVVAAQGLDGVTAWGNNLKDMEFVALREMTTIKVANAFGVPAIFLNQKGTSKYNTAPVEEREFYNTVIKPLQDQIAEIFTEEIIHSFNPEFQFLFNEPVFHDPDAIRKDALVANTQHIIDDDEIRETYFALPKKTPEQIAADEARNQTAAIATPAGDAQSNDGQQGTDDAQAAPKKTRKALENQDALAMEREAQKDELADGLEPALVGFFTAQEQRHFEAINEASGHLDAFLLDAAAVGLLHLVFQSGLNASLFAGAQAAQQQLAMPLRFDQINSMVKDYLETQAFAHAQGIIQTTTDALRASLSEGITAGESVAQLTARVQNVFTAAKTYRAQAIARTETAQAFSHANYQTAVATGLELTRTWLVSPDERTCPICLPLDGVRVGLNESYPGGLEPGFAHIQCRCDETFKTQ